MDVIQINGNDTAFYDLSQWDCCKNSFRMGAIDLSCAWTNESVIAEARLFSPFSCWMEYMFMGEVRKSEKRILECDQVG